MDKIYSRTRIRIPKINLRKNANLPSQDQKKLRKIAKIICILVIAFSVVRICLNAIYPIFEKQCINKAKSIATMISNNQATKIVQKYKYDDLSVIEKDDNGNITLIKANINPINAIISDIPIAMQEELEKQNNGVFYLKLGSLTGSKLLSGIGPSIKIQVASIGDVETDLRSEFLAAGINQTLHRIYLEVKCNVTILTPFNTITQQITNQVLLAEAVIVGIVPNTYYNLEGLTKDNALDLIE